MYMPWEHNAHVHMYNVWVYMGYIYAGYQYGHIPWADADITVLVDERGVAKFCLQELIAKVYTLFRSESVLGNPSNQG